MTLPPTPGLFFETQKRVRGCSPQAADVYWIRLTDCKTEIGKGGMGGRAQDLRAAVGPQQTLWPQPRALPASAPGDPQAPLPQVDAGLEALRAAPGT